jgi:methyl-accepting chemotaxis protein
MQKITVASQEQTGGIEQINRTITNMELTTQQNATLVEEAAAASEAMREKASELAQLVAVFKLDSKDAASARQRDGSQPPSNANPNRMLPDARPRQQRRPALTKSPGTRRAFADD